MIYFLPKSHEKAWQVVFSEDVDKYTPISPLYNGADIP